MLLGGVYVVRRDVWPHMLERGLPPQGVPPFQEWFATHIEPAVVNTTATKCLSMDLHPFSCLSIFLASAAYSVTAKALRTKDGSIGLMHVLSQHVGHCSGRAGSMKIPSIVLLFFSECRRCWPSMEDIPHHFRSCFDATSSQALWRMVEMWLMLHCVWWYPWGMVSCKAPSNLAWHLGEHL